ncbi:trypsin 3A1-like [Colias croceus]|uniref:trypsin 3A1-like n=1 Tax=Colias crocea TaxID=72248 RepID=UPI001E27D672|nr:trypsin 3A1-like [Colias croceus]
MQSNFIILLNLWIFNCSFGGLPKFRDSAGGNEQNEKELNFKAVLKENEEYSPYVDQCPLKILGGQEAAITQVPYQVSIRKNNWFGIYWSSFCGGSLITLKYVLTAAHCFINEDTYSIRNLKNVRVVGGTTVTAVTIFDAVPEQWRKIKHFYKHLNYNFTILKHDLAIVEVTKKFVECDSVKPIRLLSLKSHENVKVRQQCLVSGFGLKEKVR